MTNGAGPRPSRSREGAGGEVLAFSTPYERDGVSVIAATATRTHTATHDDPAPGHRSPFDAAMSGSRPLGAFVIRDGRVHWRPAVDLTRVITTAELVVGAVLVAQRLARRPSAAKAAVVMGPGGWVSMKGGVMAVRPAGRGWRKRRSPAGSAPAAPRPWWAKVLAAKPLQSLLG